MKNTILLFVVLVLLLGLCSCDKDSARFNESLSLGNFGYQSCHVFPADTCLPVSKWNECEIGVEIYHESYGWLYLSEGIYSLNSSDCPFCEAGD